MFRNDSLFSRFMNVLFDIICVSVLWILCSVPLLTAGAASTAAYYAMAKSVRYKTGYTVKEFFHSFRCNMKQSIPIAIVFWLIMFILLIDIWYVWTNNNKLNSAIFMVLVFILFLTAGITLYIYPLLSRFEKGTLDLIKTAAFIMFKYLPITIGMLLFLGIACIAIYLMPWALLILPGACLYGITFPMEWILRKLMPKADEEGEEAGKWYYQ